MCQNNKLQHGIPLFVFFCKKTCFFRSRYSLVETTAAQSKFLRPSGFILKQSCCCCLLIDMRSNQFLNLNKIIGTSLPCLNKNKSRAPVFRKGPILRNFRIGNLLHLRTSQFILGDKDYLTTSFFQGEQLLRIKRTSLLVLPNWKFANSGPLIFFFSLKCII